MGARDGSAEGDVDDDVEDEPIDDDIRRADELLDSILEELEEREAAIAGRSQPGRMDPPGEWLPGGSLADGREPARRPKLAYRQVGVKLSWSQYRELQHAAELYGVTPTTLARMMVNRGTRAILESNRRDAVRFSRELNR
jgi:hypothetical protein